MDTVFIENLAVEALIGHHDWEHEFLQQLHLDVDMAFDCRASGRSDALNDALDYDAVAKSVTALVRASRFRLLEALGEALAMMILRDFPCQHVRLVIRKPTAIATARAVGVVIERSSTDS